MSKFRASLPFRLLGTSLALWLSACAYPSPSVERIYGGKLVQGRYIDPNAYTAYAEAALFEAQGHLPEAKAAYQRALQTDPFSVEIWTSLARVQCRSGELAPGAAFERALEIDAGYEPIWRERGACLLERKQPQKALSDLKQALSLDPNRSDTSLLIVEALTALGRRSEAQRWLLALRLRQPQVTAHEQYRRLAHAVEDNGSVWLPPDSSNWHSDPASVPKQAELERSRVDEALVSGDLEAARKYAVRAGVAGGQLALRALALGRMRLAEQQANLVLRADPDDLDALIASLINADLADHPESFRAVLTRLAYASEHGGGPSPLAVALFGELISRRVSQQGYRAWLTSVALPKPTSDPLLMTVLERSKRSLSAP